MKRYLCSLAIFAALALAPSAKAQDPYYGEGTYASIPRDPPMPGVMAINTGIAMASIMPARTWQPESAPISRPGITTVAMLAMRATWAITTSTRWVFARVTSAVTTTLSPARRVAGQVTVCRECMTTTMPTIATAATGDVYVQRHYAVGDVAYDTGYNDGIYYAQRDLSRARTLTRRAPKGFKDGRSRLPRFLWRQGCVQARVSQWL